METHHDVQKRFIPAGAGNTCRVKPLAADLAVYPRWRGEHTTVGSWEDEEQFIPAGAGNTRRCDGIVALPAVYPRWRGEHSKHNLLLINDFLSQSQSTNFIVSHKQHIHYVKEHLIH
ncbi:Domain of uncharacterised function (DUF2825) [Escherichia coli]|nr:Domain of uncharacterised function (DUF2825) [Escherichia coli]CTV00722.1 Domain of uncharacterised function (DUF2825) [Escherichia coli]